MKQAKNRALLHAEDTSNMFLIKGQLAVNRLHCIILQNTEPLKIRGINSPIVTELDTTTFPYFDSIGNIVMEFFFNVCTNIVELISAYAI
jgi:hypothetical protein